MALQGYLGRLKVVLKDKQRKKSKFKIVQELIHSAIKNREIPTHYATKFLYRHETGNYKNYLSAGEELQVRFSTNLHRLEFHTLLKNKLASALYFEQCDLAVPKMPSYNVNQNFFNSDGTKTISDLSELKDFFLSIMDSYQLDSLFLKELAESGGVGCHLLKRDCLENSLGKIGEKLLKGSFIHQEAVKQHEVINKINPSSLNTIRFETYIDKLGQVHILSSYMRFGVGKNIVDNASSGGFFIAIDQENGKLKGKGYQKIKANGGGKIFVVHPDTKVSMDGIQVPFFKEACDLVYKAVEYVPERYVGWDVAISATGPLIIEGNGAPHIMLADIAYGGYRKHPLYSEVLQEAYKAPKHESKIMFFKNLIN
ncbi:MAG TPA: hypothetical protein ENH91_10965 [Leeuwenhoekiella sp.]|nr:hypothetical protein [Leeuwenhoekiella sp.]